MGKPIHEDTPEEALIRHNTAVLLSIGMSTASIARGSKIDPARFYAFTESRGNLREKEIQQLLQYFKKIKKYILQMMK